jgi:hypothetical protein
MLHIHIRIHTHTHAYIHTQESAAGRFLHVIETIQKNLMLRTRLGTDSPCELVFMLQRSTRVHFMRVCACMYLPAYIYIYIYICIYVYIYVSDIFAYIYIYMHVCVHMYFMYEMALYTYMHVCVRMCLMCQTACTHICMCETGHIHMCIYGRDTYVCVYHHQYVCIQVDIFVANTFSRALIVHICRIRTDNSSKN